MTKADVQRRRKRQSKIVNSDNEEEHNTGEENTPTVTVSLEKNEADKADDSEQRTSPKSGKRKTDSNTETCPSKKTKLINDGFCLFVGNLNNSKTNDEIKDSLANYLMTQSLLFQDIRLHPSKKHAHVDLASAIDLNKALALDGEMILDKPMKIAKAKVKSVKEVKEKTPKNKKAARNARCLFLKNLPYNTTKEEIMELFPKAIAVRFPDGTEGPSHGIAFVEFENESIAKKMQTTKRAATMQGRVLIVDFVPDSNVPKVTKVEDVSTKVDATPNNTLYVGNLARDVKEKKLKTLFQEAVSIKIPKKKGYALVKFASVADAEKALQSTQNVKICKRELKVQFSKMRDTSEKAIVQFKTLIVHDLSEKTTAETLKDAFEGAHSARIIVNKKTGVSKKFGFVAFESEENCRAVKKAMEDCEIDGSKVSVAYARSKGRGVHGATGELAASSDGQPAGQGAGRGGRRRSRAGKGRGADLSQDTVNAENKG